MEIKYFYKHIFNIKKPHLYQIEVWDKSKRYLSKGSPILIRAPAGAGKTEAVLAPFLRQFVEKEFFIAPRLIYVLPMRVLINQIKERIERYAKNITPDTTVKIQHGDIPDSPFFIGDIIITTLDQFIYGFARASRQVGHHLDVPAGAIASSLIVFDESHMYRDEFTFSVMRAILEILNNSNIPFVVMTATMPETLEKSLFENIDLKEDQKIEGDISIENEVIMHLEEKPLINEEGINIPQELLQKIQNKKTLIVVNQVKRAQRIYDEIKRILELKEDEIVLLHSRFIKRDREIHENKAIELMKDRENNIRIVVSTQVLEAGMDFSADILITEIAPADAIVQRAGRCARYKGEKGEMHIFQIENGKGCLPYKKEDIEKTFKWLKEHNDFDIKDFKQVQKFVNILEYKAEDYEARDTLIDLYECVLYADQKPENIQVRKNKPVKIFVVDFSQGIDDSKKKKSEKEIIEQAIKKIGIENINENSFDVDIKVAWVYFKDKLIKWKLKWEFDEKENKNKWDVEPIRKDNKEPEEEDPAIVPFYTYILDVLNYDKTKGVVKDEATVI